MALMMLPSLLRWVVMMMIMMAFIPSYIYALLSLSRTKVKVKSVLEKTASSILHQLYFHPLSSKVGVRLGLFQITKEWFWTFNPKKNVNIPWFDWQRIYYDADPQFCWRQRQPSKMITQLIRLLWQSGEVEHWPSATRRVTEHTNHYRAQVQVYLNITKIHFFYKF